MCDDYVHKASDRDKYPSWLREWKIRNGKKVVENYNCSVNSFDILFDNEDFPSISKDRGNRRENDRMLTPRNYGSIIKYLKSRFDKLERMSKEAGAS